MMAGVCAWRGREVCLRALVPRLCLGTHCLRGSASPHGRCLDAHPQPKSRRTLPGPASPGRAWARGQAEPARQCGPRLSLGPRGQPSPHPDTLPMPPTNRSRLILFAVALAALAALVALARTGVTGTLPMHDFVEYWAAGRL